MKLVNAEIAINDKEYPYGGVEEGVEILVKSEERTFYDDFNYLKKLRHPKPTPVGIWVDIEELYEG